MATALPGSTLRVKQAGSRTNISSSCPTAVTIRPVNLISLFSPSYVFYRLFQRHWQRDVGCLTDDSEDEMYFLYGEFIVNLRLTQLTFLFVSKHCFSAGIRKSLPYLPVLCHFLILAFLSVDLMTSPLVVAGPSVCFYVTHSSSCDPLSHNQRAFRAQPHTVSLGQSEGERRRTMLLIFHAPHSFFGFFQQSDTPHTALTHMPATPHSARCHSQLIINSFSVTSRR